jgi:hypothetical protein
MYGFPRLFRHEKIFGKIPSEARKKEKIGKREIMAIL